LDAYDRYSGFMKERQTQIGTMYNNAVQHEENLLKMEEDRKKEDAEVLRKTNEQIGEVLKDAAKSGASNEVLSKIATAKTVNEAIQYAGNNLSSGTGIVGEYNFYAREERAAGRTPVSFDEYQTRDANRKVAVARASANGLPTEVVNQIDKVSTSFDNSPIVKNFVEVQNKRNTIEQIIEKGTGGPADMALVYEFMRSLDPTSVVRETEYATAAQSGNVFQGVWAKFNGLFKAKGGKLPENVKEEFQNLINIKYDTLESDYEKLRSEKARLINIKTGTSDGDQYLIDYKSPTSKVIKTEADYFDSLLQENPTVPFAGQQIPFQDAVAAINAMPEYQNLSDSEVMQILGVEVPEDFNQDLSTSQNGSPDVAKIADAIGQYESGGNYKARGPVVTSGQYKGERALGKYQIMPGNLPSWSKQAVGRVVTEQEFLSNPKIQDQIAQYQMDKIYKQYGNLEDVASVWFSGRPLGKAGNAKDVIGTSVPTYVKNIRAIYNKTG